MDPSIATTEPPLSAATRRHEWLAIAVVAGVLIWLLAPILLPFVISAFFGYLGDPLADRLERAHLSRTFSVSLVFFVMTFLAALALFFLVPVLGEQISHFVAQMPVYADWVRGTALPWINQHAHLDLSPYLDPQQLVDMLRKHWQDAGVATSVLGQVSRSGLLLIQVISTVLLVPVLSFYFLRDWDELVERIDMLLPRDIEPTIARLARQSDEMLGGFVRGQLLVMVCMGVWYASALWMAGLDLALLIGLLTGLLSFVPYLGVTIGIGVSVLAALVQYGDLQHVLLVAGAFAIGQTLESFVLVPRLVGDKIGMHPVGVIFALMAGGQLFGFLGVLLALPVSAIAMVLLRYAHERYTTSRLYAGRDGAPVEPSAPSAPPDAASGPRGDGGTPSAA
ncbi:MAG: AI-2E family transporter [Proteobacteria bacterium]|nr:AI-2E family transporter [Pseudomonadota bacterium]